MPVTIKKQTIKYRNPDGTYTDFNAVAQESAADQIAAIQASGAAEVQDVEAAGSAQIAAVNQAGATQIAAVEQAIEDKGEEVKASIPEEYSDLSADVVDLKSSINQKAPAITGETTSKYSFSANELAGYDNGYELICNATGLESVYAIKAENILPDFDPINAGNGLVTSDGGLKFHFNGTNSSASNFYPKVNESTNFNPIKPLHVGDKINLSCLATGTVTDATYPFRVSLYFRNLDGTSTENVSTVAYANFGEVVSKTFVVEKECKLQITCTVRTGEYVNCDLIFTAEIVTNEAWETISVPESGSVTLSSADVGTNGITILPVTSIVRYVIDTKTYVDEHIPDDMLVESDLIYVSPEMFGATGDGVTDDSAALQACVNAAIQRGVAVRGYGKYLTSQPVTCIGQSQNVYLHNLIYTGSDAGFVLIGSYNCIRIDRLYAYNSTGAGFRLTTNANQNASYNKIDLGSVYAYTNGIEYVNNLGAAESRKEMYYNVLHVQNLFSRNANGIFFHSTGGQGNENSFWGKHVGCSNGWLLYCDEDSATTTRLYEFCFENLCAKGVYGRASLFNCRTTECMDKKRPDNGDVGTIFKFTSTPEARWTGTQIDYDCIDVTECDTFIERYDYMNQLYQGGSTPALAYASAFGSGKNYVLGDCRRLWDYYVRHSNGLCPSGKLIAYFNHKGFVPNDPWYHKISVSDYTPLVTDKFVPTVFDIDTAQCTIHLEDSYCCVGIKEITLIQYADKKAIVYEKNNSTTPIFDGTNLDAGTYRFTCTMLPTRIDILNADSSVASTTISDNLYFGDNERWTVERLNIVN